MTKKNKLIILICSIVVGALAIFGATFALIFANQERISYQKIYYGVYGEWFILPENDSVKVYYEDGTRAEVVANRVFIDDDGDYKLVFKSVGKKTKSTLKINVNEKPAVYVSKQIVYGTVNNEVELPKVTAHDGVNQLTVTKKLFKGEKEIDITNGFTPTEVGEYKLVVSASGKGGNVQEKVVSIYVEESVKAYEDKITSFDKPYGENQLMYADYKSEYTTDVKFEDELGSLKLSVNSGSDIAIINTEIHDISNYDAIYFYIYKDCDVGMGFSLTYAYWVDDLKTREWTPIVIDVDKIDSYIQEGGYAPVKENVSTKNINGLMMAIGLSDFEDYVFSSDAVYLSSIRAIKHATVKELNRDIEEILNRGQITERERTVIEYQYSRLTQSEQAKILRYGEFQTLKLNQMFNKEGITPVPNKVLYFDNEIGLSQVSLPWSDFDMSITDEKTYKGESVLKIEVLEEKWGTKSSEVCFTIDQPFIYDLTDYDYITFAVYFEHDNDLILHNDDYIRKGLGVQGKQTLKAGEWNEVKLALGDMTNVEDSFVWIIEKDWEKDFNHDVDFYFSSFYVGKGNEDNVGYKLAFDESTGVDNLESFNNVNFEYVTDVKYGTEAGSTKFYPGSNAEKLENDTQHTAQLYAYINDAQIKSYSGNAVFRTHVYYDGTMNQSVYILPKGYYDLPMASKTMLKKGEWTEVFFYLPEGKTLDEYGIMIMDEPNGWRFKMNEAVYFGAFEFVRYYESDGIEFDKEYGIAHAQVVDSAKLEYDTTIKYGSEDGSLKISVDESETEISKGFVKQIYINLLNTNASTKNGVYKTRVYYAGDNDYSLYMMEQGYYDLNKATEYKLNKGGWTEIEFLLKPQDSFTNYSIVIMTENWEFAKDDVVYISAFKCESVLDPSGIDFSVESGVNGLKSVWNASVSYSTEIKYGEEVGSTKISAKEDANGKQLYVNFECQPSACISDTTATFYVYNQSDKDVVIYVMKTNYWNTANAVSTITLKAGEWTKVSFTILADTSLDDYSLQIMTGNETFDSNVSLYLSKMELD